jgi:hypothetical protein
VSVGLLYEVSGEFDRYLSKFNKLDAWHGLCIILTVTGPTTHKTEKRPMRTAKITSALVLVAAAAGISTNASAIVLTQGDANYIGYVFDGIPANESAEVLMINSLLDMSAGAVTTPCSQIVSEDCNRVGSTLDVSGFADATVTDFTKNETGSAMFTVGGYQYIIGKYDGPNYGDLVWYIGNLTGTHSIQTTAGGYDLSHYTLYNPGTIRVPEPATLTLLSLGLLGVGFTASRRRRQSA